MKQKFPAPHLTGKGVLVVHAPHSDETRRLAKEMKKHSNYAKHPIGLPVFEKNEITGAPEFKGYYRTRYPFDTFKRLNQRQKRKRAKHA